jgi:hypothetical protein
MGLALLVVAGVRADWVGATPTAQDRQQIQGMINRGDPLRAEYVKDRATFVGSYRAWKNNPSEANRQTALADLDSLETSEAAVKSNRDSVIAKVDSTFDTNEPAGTDVQYDPECTDYGYTSSRCFVRICEPSFGSPDDVATTKIHEFEHVRQKRAGKWGPGNVPQPCTFLYHQLEFDAYEAEMDADFGKRTSLGIDTKLEILERKLEHLEGMLTALGVKVQGDKVTRALPGTVVEKEVTVTNDSDFEQGVTVESQNQQGWPLLPGPFSTYLASEGTATFTLVAQVPTWAELNRGNEVMCSAVSGSGDEARDFFFIHAIPVVEVRKGADVSGRSGHWVDFEFTVVNEGPTPDEFDVRLTSVLGWPLAQDQWMVPLGPGGSAVLAGGVLIPDGAPYTTDLLLCAAASMGVPGQADSAWVYAEIEPGVTGVEEPEVTSLALLPSVPNPAVGGTRLRFTMPARGPVELGLYDVAGRLVRTLVGREGGELGPGLHTVAWDGRDDGGRRVAGGVYFARLRALQRDVVRKLVVLQ